jgi:hypothetical protein
MSTTPVTQPTKKIEEQRFEFVLYINSNIICQRYFNIRDYNNDCITSIELKELMDAIVGVNNGTYGSMGIIPRFFKQKAIDYLWKNYNPYVTRSEPYKNNFEKEDLFHFEIKVDRKTIAKSQFSGNLFPQQVRYGDWIHNLNKYQIDIKEILPTIISEIKTSLSQREYYHILDEYKF